MNETLQIKLPTSAELNQGRLRDLEFDYANAVRECDRLATENNSLRTSLAARNAQYWELHEAVSRLFKTIEGEKLIAAQTESA